MSTENNSTQVSALLSRLEGAMGKKQPGGGKKDWAAINAAKKAAFWKPKEGKNTILVLTPSFGEDPFTFWGFHKGLQEVDYWSTPCDHYNKDEDCVVCNIVKGLKAEGREANKHLWMPIEQKTETYVPIVDYSSTATIAEGPKWFRMSKTIMEQLVNSIKSLEEGEVPFYDETSPQRLILTYDKNEKPQSMYNVQLKVMKDVPSEKQYADWKVKILPVSEYITSKSTDEVKKIVDEYFVRVSTELENTQDETVNESSDDSNVAEDTTPSVKSKLDKLKK